MNANKDEAYRCISIAQQCFRSGNVQKARKFVIKAMKLYPEIEIDGLEPLLRSKSKSPSRRESADANTPEAGTSSNDHAPPPPTQPAFTKSQVEAVREVLACKDYYELFGLTRQCTEDELKKAYRTLALKFHPDKNSAPGATEAFKKIGTAFSVLTDPEKRRRYDQFGMAEEQEEQTVHVRRHTDAYFQNDVELFTMLFNFGFPFPQGHRHRHRPTRSRDSEHESNYFVYVQLIPLIILFALSFFSSIFVKEPFYNLARSNKYFVERHTQKHNVPYYVKKTFEQEFDGSIVSLENQVEEEYVGNLRFRCFRQKEYKENLIFRARYYGDDGEYQRATQMRMPDCERLVEMFGG